jgi:hydrogenase nickel incorporation protein HypB
MLSVEQDILSKNNLLAERNKGYLEAKEIFCINLMSSPGSGKTTLLESTAKLLKDKMKMYVIEGDQQTDNDAVRMEEAGIASIQINTGTGCHLDAAMINTAVKQLQPQAGSLLFIENVGNLVCPALFNLGEHIKVVVASVTEGDDKPLKYPNIFQESNICVLNKTDLLPYVKFDAEAFKKNASLINPSLSFFDVSATSGEGMDKWCAFLKEQRVEAES